MVTTNPLLINVVDLRRVVGHTRDVRVEQVFDDLALTTVRVADDAPVGVAVLLESLTNSIGASGTLSVRWMGECRRCLEPVEGALVVEVDEVFEERPTEGETWPIVNDHVDLAPMVRELVLLALPLNPLCSEECAGPAPGDVPVTVEGEGAVEPPRDPRWAALDALRLDGD